MIKKYEEFINELRFNKIDGSGNERNIEDRKENERVVTLPDGNEFCVDLLPGVPLKFDDGEYYTTIKFNGNDDRYVFCCDPEDSRFEYGYYVFNPDPDIDYEEDGIELTILSDFDLEDDDNGFVIIRALTDEGRYDIDDSQYEISYVDSEISFYKIYMNFGYNDRTFVAFEEEWQARKYAEDKLWKYYKHLTDKDDDFFFPDDKKISEIYYGYGKDDLLYTREMENDIDAIIDGQVSDYKIESGEYDNRFNDELIDRGIIEDSEDYFEVDDDGELDYSSPKYDECEMYEKLKEALMDEIDDYCEYLREMGGWTSIRPYFNVNKVVEAKIDRDGVGNIIRDYYDEYNEIEYHCNDKTIYIYQES